MKPRDAGSNRPYRSGSFDKGKPIDISSSADSNSVDDKEEKTSKEELPAKVTRVIRSSLLVQTGHNLRKREDKATKEKGR